MDRMTALGKRVYLNSDDRVQGVVTGYAFDFDGKNEPRTLLVVTLDVTIHMSALSYGGDLNATVTKIVVDESAVSETI